MPAFLLVLLLKLLAGTILDLYSDEIFYWQASTRPALAYSDLPFMTALLAGLGANLFGHNPLAVRSAFILLGSLLPLLVFWVARPLLPSRQAMEAALLSLCLPLAGFLGTLAVPDVPLVITGLLTLGLFERATRLNEPRFWIALGIVAAIGMCTHYRFFLYPLAALGYLILTSAQRHQFRNPWLWVAVALMGAGLLPIVLFNLGADLSGLEYHLADRHPWAFQAEGLLHIFRQALLVTPPLYVLLLITLVHLFRRSRAGDDRSALFMAFSLTHLGVFFVLAPWADSTRTSIHWPLAGYLPLIVFLPRTLRHLQQRFGQRAWLRAVPVLGFAGTLVAFLGIGSQAFQQQLQPLLGTGVLSTKMAGWSEMTAHLRQLAGKTEQPPPLIVTDNYYTAAQVEFALPADFRVYTIDADKAARDGRSAQYRLWAADEIALREVAAGESAWFITEDSTLTLPEKIAAVSRACSLFPDLRLVDQLALFRGDKAFSFYRGSGSTSDAGPCPLPSQAWIDSPREDRLTGIVTVAGWAFNDGPGIALIELLLNGDVVSVIERRVPRPDVREALGATDPAGDMLGYSMPLDTRQFSDGPASLSLRVTSAAGEVQQFREVLFEIANGP